MADLVGDPPKSYFWEIFNEMQRRGTCSEERRTMRVIDQVAKDREFDLWGQRIDEVPDNPHFHAHRVRLTYADGRVRSMDVPTIAKKHRAKSVFEALSDFGILYENDSFLSGWAYVTVDGEVVIENNPSHVVLGFHGNREVRDDVGSAGRMPYDRYHVSCWAGSMPATFDEFLGIGDMLYGSQTDWQKLRLQFLQATDLLEPATPAPIVPSTHESHYTDLTDMSHLRGRGYDYLVVDDPEVVYGEVEGYRYTVTKEPRPMFSMPEPLGPPEPTPEEAVAGDYDAWIMHPDLWRMWTEACQRGEDPPKKHRPDLFGGKYMTGPVSRPLMSPGGISGGTLDL